MLETAAVEIGAALLADTEYLLDHSAEHRASVHEMVTAASWNSDAWTAVTTYYWAFFSALAITRLCGRATWFLDREALSDFRTLAGSLVQPGAGPFSLRTASYTSATMRTLELRPSRMQFHDAAWAAFHSVLAEIVTNTDQYANPDEFRFWRSLKRPGDLFGTNWASKLRNALNYRPGCGYREVTRSSRIELGRYIQRVSPASIGDITQTFENELNAISTSADPSEDVRSFSRLLVSYAFLAAAVIESLHADVLSRQSGDLRWRALRNTFLATRCAPTNDVAWPYL